MFNLNFNIACHSVHLSLKRQTWPKTTCWRFIDLLTTSKAHRLGRLFCASLLKDAYWPALLSSSSGRPRRHLLCLWHDGTNICFSTSYMKKYTYTAQAQAQACDEKWLRAPSIQHHLQFLLQLWLWRGVQLIHALEETIHTTILQASRPPPCIHRYLDQGEVDMRPLLLWWHSCQGSLSSRTGPILILPSSSPPHCVLGIIFSVFAASPASSLQLQRASIGDRHDGGSVPYVRK